MIHLQKFKLQTGLLGAGRQNPNQQKKGDTSMKTATKINRNHPIIHDFIDSRNDLDGCGYFKGDKEAIEYARMVGKNQKLKFQKHAIIPKALVMLFAKHLTFPEENNPVKRNVNYGDFLTLLMRGPYKNKLGRQVCEKFYHDLICKNIPWLKQSFAKADNLYD
ncbi:MAG TPA: hypothetical protein PLJ21_13580 [Pseudobdellovibrionaceae bacterium]|nr:hypothetical protein [Pseudobdellovibrionaceae bacterium]